MKTFTVTLTDVDLEHLQVLVNSRVYRNLTEEQIISNVLCVAMYEEAKLYGDLHDYNRSKQ